MTTYESNRRVPHPVKELPSNRRIVPARRWVTISQLRFAVLVLASVLGLMVMAVGVVWAVYE